MAKGSEWSKKTPPPGGSGLAYMDAMGVTYFPQAAQSLLL
jgi:hypothetical protein